VEGLAAVLGDPSQGGHLPEPGRIVVCAAGLPAHAPVLATAAGLVTDFGGRLSHGAILARELGLPAVLGTRTATTRIRDAQPIWLDGNRGLVIPR
jgi:rifampicin phosphotransferase